MSWGSRFFEERYAWLRLLLLDLSGVAYLTLHPLTHAPGWREWAVGGVAFAGALITYRMPFAGSLVQSFLLLLSHVADIDPTISRVGSTWALLELAMRARRPWHVTAGGLTVFAAYVVDVIGDSPLEIAGSLMGIAPIVALPILFGLNIRNSRELARRAREQVEEERRRLESESRATRADERSTVARELHDVVAHHVASMVLRVGVARHVLPDVDPRVTEVFDDVHGTGTAALADLRRLVAVLRNPDGPRKDAALTAIEPGSLPAALGAAVERARGTGIVVDADIAPEVGTLDAVRGMAVLRLTQEALTNVAKHAGAQANVRLRVTLDADALHWEVQDDGGTGTASTAKPVGGGHGITGMRERVEVLGGRLDAGPHATGWRVKTVLHPPGSES
ncbi:two-component sensor histidine kinase [Virgisporangium aliadipatigenens]|uniref:histidine kinase n=1 Tax=Virgisporangium aliadipatigenens TaxID=741659 RepID=A0A8J4DN54_9ACTN|nr:histidine kinase [Virgisporangium aliadipatigenens]GIJ43197.1 two-component sensor histidine kinase [Virgisporangium aliadipatigenens]